MEWSEVLDPSLKPGEVLGQRLKQMHGERRERISALLKSEVILCLRLDKEVHTIAVRGDGYRWEPREMIDFPQATVLTDHDRWRRSLGFVEELIEPAEERLDEYRGRWEITDELLRRFERFDGVLEVEVRGLPDGGAPMAFEVVLNDYQEVGGSPRAVLKVEWEVLKQVAHGQLNPTEAARKVEVGGARGLALELGGFAATELDL